MKDQFGNNVPDDLVVLEGEWLTLLPDAAIKGIDKLDWYEYRTTSGASTPLLASAKGIQSAAAGIVFDTYSLDDCGFPTAQLEEVQLISPVLHRYSGADGWFHA
jgi:hypothetical protein